MLCIEIKIGKIISFLLHSTYFFIFQNIVPYCKQNRTCVLIQLENILIHEKESALLQRDLHRVLKYELKKVGKQMNQID